MKTRLSIAIALLATFFAGTPTATLAWGREGHRIIGTIANGRIAPKTRSAITALLGVETLAEASTAPDFERSNPDAFWQHTAGPLHYVTVPTGKTYAEVGAPPEGDAVTGLEMFAKTVRDKTAPLADRQRALRFIVHIVGDLHQPLHAGNGTDKGGNEVRVTWFGKPTNLHAVWDSSLVDEEALSFTEYADRLNKRITPADDKRWRDPNPLTWIGESALIRDTIYPASPTLNYTYHYAWRSTVERRLDQAGVRLAAYLDKLFS